MSVENHESRLELWLPQLEAYQAALDATPGDAMLTRESKLPMVVADSRSLAVSSADRGALPADTDPPLPASFGKVTEIPGPQITHLPIDGILKRIGKSKPFVLGIGSIGGSDPLLVRSVVNDIVARCCAKSERNAILITVRQTTEVNPDDCSDKEKLRAARFNSKLPVRRASWTFFGEAKSELKTWHSQLADLPRWKKEFELIAFDFGDVCFPKMRQIGRLCDGIVVPMFTATNSRESIRSLKSLQKERLNILGVWSVAFPSQNQAA